MIVGKRIYLLPNLVLIIRLTCFVCFLIFAIDVNIYSATFLLLTIGNHMFINLSMILIIPKVFDLLKHRCIWSKRNLIQTAITSK